APSAATAGSAAQVPRNPHDSGESFRQELLQGGPVSLLLFPLDGGRSYLRDRHLLNEVRAGFTALVVGAAGAKIGEALPRVASPAPAPNRAGGRPRKGPPPPPGTRIHPPDDRRSRS